MAKIIKDLEETPLLESIVRIYNYFNHRDMYLEMADMEIEFEYNTDHLRSFVEEYNHLGEE